MSSSNPSNNPTDLLSLQDNFSQQQVNLFNAHILKVVLIFHFFQTTSG